MSITITATAGSATANSYVTEAEAIAIAAVRLNLPATWTTVSGSTCTEIEKKALIEAQRELTLLAWLGERTDTTQILAWPRQFVTDPDAPALSSITDITQLYFDDDELPTRVKNAQIELAFEFLRAGTTDLAGLDPTIGIVREVVDVIETEYAQPYQRAQGLARFPRIQALVAPLLRGSSGGLDVVRV